MAEAAISKQLNGLSFGPWEKHGAAIVTGVCLLFIGLAWAAGLKGLTGLEVTCYVLAYVVGGYQQAMEGLETLFKEKDLDVDLLMVVAATGAAAIGYWMDGAILIFIFSLSGTLEGYTMERTNRDIRSIMKLRPEEAVLLADGKERTVKAEELKKGDIIVVRPGERIAADGLIIRGHSAIYQGSITGEALPVDKKAGDEVFAGTINRQGALEVEVTKPAAETTLAKIIHLVQQAKDEKPPSQLFVERFESIYAKAVVSIAVLLMVLPPFLIQWTWHETIYRAMIFLVVASPCALVASIMPVVLSGISNAARKGVLIKGGIHLENAGAVKVVAFDKTGTLTSGKIKVVDIFTFGELTDTGLLRLAAAIESLSEHPIAKAVVQAAAERNIAIERSAGLQAVHGLGVRASLNGVDYQIGRKDMFAGTVISGKHHALALKLEEQGKTVVYMAASDEIIGMLSIQDVIRPQARAVISELKKMGVKVALLTGDNYTTAGVIARQAGIDEVYAELLPEQKVEIIKQLESGYGKVAMVGDGVNDAPALATASVGIAMGNSGTDVAMETADIILMADHIEHIPFLIGLGRKAGRVVKQNVIFAIAVAFTLVILNFIGGVINLPEGVVGHEGSTVLVILSGLRLLR